MTIPEFSIDLGTLLAGVDYELLFMPEGGDPALTSIRSITGDSREAGEGGLFVAIEGLRTDGHLYLEQAVAGGCVALICSRGRVSRSLAEKLGVIVVEVVNTVETYARAAANFFGNPGGKLCCIGITGTNGKTTVSYLVEHVLLALGKTVGVLGTVNNRYMGSGGAQKVVGTQLTTPDPLSLQAFLAEMVAAGVQYLVMEVSSHALVQRRVAPISYQVAAFTNLSRDHLDYHGSMEEYFAAKKRLFSQHLREDGIAVIPAGDVCPGEGTESAGENLRELCEKYCSRIISWGGQEHADVRLLGCSSGLRSTSVQISCEKRQYSFTTPLIGRFNVENLLTTFAIGRALGLDADRMCESLKGAAGAPGRLERVLPGNRWKSRGPVVLVDYAHTPDALIQVLQNLRELPHGELFCVFGCGGDRDRGKRPVMGKAAALLSSVPVITDDNPRGENPDAIIDQIRAGVEKTGVPQREPAWLPERRRGEAGYVVIRDRRRAIETAIRAAAPDDIVLLAGKGHEPYQLTAQGKHYFDDAREARDVLFSWTVALLAEAVSGRIVAGPAKGKLLGVVHTDSRLREKQSVFVALVGDNHDGHDYAAQAVENGAACIVTQREIALPSHLGASQIIVGDTTQALGDLARFRRAAMAEAGDLAVIGITGSCGKTTVKEMAAAILKRKWPAGEKYPQDCVLKTRGNFNNLIGLPLSLLPLQVKHRAAVLEMGMNRPGELLRLGSIADPDVSCITNVYGAHLEGLQDIEGVARAKEELFQATGPAGKLVINLDDPFVRDMARRHPQSKITFSTDKDSCGSPPPDLWAEDMVLEQSGITKFVLHYGGRRLPVALNIAGEHNIANALCAAAVSLAVGADLEEVVAGLADFRPPDKRMQIFKGRGGVSVINDTYNANPASMSAGLKALKQLTTRRCGAILGDMLELGHSAAAAHYEIGRLVAELRLDYVAVAGEFRGSVERGAVEAGFDRDRIRAFADKEAAARWVLELIEEKNLGQDDILLVKASRGLRFETVVSQLYDNTADTCTGSAV